MSTAPADLDATDRGEPATEVEYRYEPERTVGLLGDTIARLHSAAAPDGWAQLRAADVVELARTRIESGEVRPDTLDPAYAHMEPARLLGVLASGAAAVDAHSGVVPTHGRADLAHLRCDGGRPLGFADWSAAALADPYRDLAVAARSVALDLGPMLVPDLLERAGHPQPDPVRLDWWALADVLTGAP
ncbi:MAG: phosphotransferase [Microthrixaceae bacterium]